jgi:hypothetical protein
MERDAAVRLVRALVARRLGQSDSIADVAIRNIVAQAGFGTSLLKAVCEDVRFSFASSGLICEIDLPHHGQGHDSRSAVF